MGLDNSCNLPIISFSRSAPLSGWRMVKVARELHELHIAKGSPRPLLLVAKAKVPNETPGIVFREVSLTGLKTDLWAGDTGVLVTGLCCCILRV